MTVGLTEHQKRAFDAIMSFVALHGAVPSIEALARLLECSKTNAWQMVDALHERGYIQRSVRGMIALGSGGVSVVVPAHVAAKLAAFRRGHDEHLSAVVADAISLHLDALAGADPSIVESVS